MAVLITGGAGYIGSHTVKFLLENKNDVIVVDNLSRGNYESLPKGIKFYECNISDRDRLSAIFANNKIDSIIHFAAFAYVGESVEQPELYYWNNVVGSLTLIDVAVKFNVEHFVFSSTCSIYGNTTLIPISEEHAAQPINPYANTKMAVEKILKDYSNKYGFNFISLRYFNAAGASIDSSIGESHNPEPHIIPILLQSVLNQKKVISVFGDDYNTRDGTCVRDYIHVVDLAEAHYLALKYLKANGNSEIINLGTGKGHSILELIKLTEVITGGKINYKIVARRAGDPDILIADNAKAKKLLNWEPKFTINEILKTAWEWHKIKKY